jgi:hypothetical protein
LPDLFHGEAEDMAGAAESEVKRQALRGWHAPRIPETPGRLPMKCRQPGRARDARGLFRQVKRAKTMSGLRARDGGEWKRQRGAAWILTRR